MFPQASRPPKGLRLLRPISLSTLPSRAVLSTISIPLGTSPRLHLDSLQFPRARTIHVRVQTCSPLVSRLFVGNKLPPHKLPPRLRTCLYMGGGDPLQSSPHPRQARSNGLAELAWGTCVPPSPSYTALILRA